MANRPHRRLTLADGLILIAAVEGGLGIARLEQDLEMLAAVGWISLPAEAGWMSLHPGALLRCESALLAIQWAALLVTLALIPLRLRQPRPPMRRVRRQPGFIACAVVAFALAYSSVGFAIMAFRDGTRSGLLSGFLMTVSPPSGEDDVVLLAWFVLLLFGRWRPEPSWIDRLGRALGIAWIIDSMVLLLFP